MDMMFMKQKGLSPRQETILSVVTLMPPLIGALVLHWVAIGRIPSIPLKLALWAAFIQVALVGLLGLRAGCLIQHWRLSSAVSVIGTITLGMLAVYLTRVYLSVHDMQVFACLLPLTWTVVWGAVTSVFPRKGTLF